MVFSSITDEDIVEERAKSVGVLAFKLFLRFARTGKLSLAHKTDREHDSVFEEQVAKALSDAGHDVHAQIGLAGFYIDLAIADRDRPGRFVLGIECDGAAYHSSRAARDRDRLRQAVLEDHGWIIHRIWSTDWFNRPQQQLQRALAAIEAAKTELESRLGKAAAEAASTLEIVTVEREDHTSVGIDVTNPAEAVSTDPLALPYLEATFQVPAHLEMHEVSVVTMANLAKRVVEIEGPIHADEVVARLRGLWGSCVPAGGSRTASKPACATRRSSGGSRTRMAFSTCRTACRNCAIARS